MKILVTGGAGYIGSTTVSALLDSGHEVVVLDSLITGKQEFTKGKSFYMGDISDTAMLERIFREHSDIDCCIHFAALIVVPDSVTRPYHYYTENVCKSLELFNSLEKLGCRKIVFSSSASIYDMVPGFKVDEEAPKNPQSPYARTKFIMEMALQDICRATPLNAIALRYFNPIGADPGMRSGPYDASPSHVMGKMVNVALGKDDCFKITGVDWPTRDGSGIRDYIHVWDLARAHVLAVEKFDHVMEKTDSGYLPINLGTGNGVTVKELVAAFEQVWGSPINKVEAPPRPGDVAGAYADCARAKELLGWKAELSTAQGIADALKWTDSERKKILGY